jgi:VCBS repeat-containing protein
MAALLVYGGSIVLGATAGTTKASSPKKLTLACAAKGSGKLQYVAQSSECPASRGTLVRFPKDSPVRACQLTKGNPGVSKAALPPPAHPHHVAGMLFRVTGPGQCHGPKYPDSKPVFLPKAQDVKLCAGKRHGTVRVVAKFSQCNNLEFDLILKKLATKPAPKAANDSATTDEDHFKNINVLANDPGPGPLHVSTINTTGTKGTVTKNGNGTLRYDPNGKFESLKVGQTGHDSFKYRANDGSADSGLATVNLTITGVNDAPTATDDTAGTDKDTATTIAVLTNDTDPEGEALSTASVDTTGTKGSVTINPDGTIAYDPNGQFASLGPSDTEHDTFKYKANDSHADSNSATVDVTVTGINHPPVLSNIESGALAYDTGSGGLQVTSSIEVSEPDGTTLKSATVKVTSGFNSPTDATKGSDSLSFVDELGITHDYDSSTGVLTLTSASGASASDWQQALRDVKYSASSPTPAGSRTLSFQIDDGGNGNHLSNVVSRDVTLTHVNHAPSATADTATTSENASTVISVLANDSDPDEDTPLHIGSTDTTGTQGTVILNPDNTFTYDPNGKFESLKPGDTATDTFKYRAADPSNSPSNEVTVTVTITGVNDAPVLAAIEGTALAYDTGSGDAQITNSTTVADIDSTNLAKATVKVSSGYVNGKDTLSFADTATISGDFDSSTGTLTLTGDDTLANYQQALHDVQFSSSATTPSGSRTVSFQAFDTLAGANNASNVVTRGITVTHVNHAPSADDDLPETTEDAPTDVPVLSNDSDVDGDALHVSSVDTTGTLGTVTINGDNTIKYDPNGKFESLKPGDTASDTFKYKAADTSNLDSNEATVTVTITGVNDAPALAAIEGTPLAYDTGSGATQITNSTLVADVDSANLAKATVKVSSGYASGKDTLSFAPEFGITATFDAPSGTLDMSSALGSSVSDWQQALHDVKFSSSATTPSGSRTISFQVDDGETDNHLSNTVTRDITVTHVNHAPVATLDADSTSEDASKDVAVLSNDSDVDGDALHVSSVDTTGTTGTVTINPDNTIKYDPNGQFNSLGPGDTASDTFKYKAADPSNVDSNQVTVTMTINGANDAPVLSAIESAALPYDTGDPGTPITSTLDVADVDSTNLAKATVQISAGYVNGDTLSFTNTANITAGAFDTSTRTLTLTGSDTVGAYKTALRSVKFFASGPTPSGSRTISFQAFDSLAGANNASNVATRDITVTNDNVAPTDITLSQDTIASDQASGTAVGTFSSTDADIGDPHTYTLVSGTGSADNAKFTIDGDTLKTAIILPTGDYTIRVQTDDGRGGTFPKQFTIHAIPDAPPTDIGLDNSSVAENQPQGTDVGTLSSVDTDGGPTFTYSLVAGNGTNDADNGDFQIDNANSKLEVSHALDFEAKAQRKIVIRTDDGKGAHFDEAFTIDVTNVNEAPTSVSLTNASVAENQPTGTNVGDLSAVDPENDSITFTLAPGVTDNDSFKITGGNKLDTNAVFDFETKSSYTVTVTAKDPGNLSKDQTFLITITNANEAPAVTAGGTLNYTENQVATAIDTGITVTEPDGEMLTSGSASITTGFQSGEDVLGWTDTDGPGGIDLAPSTNQTINLTGAGTAAQYAAALKAVTYRNSSDAPTTADRTVTFSVTDANASPATGSATSTVKVAAVDDPPDAKDDQVAGADAITEDANATAIPVLANDTDADLGLKEITAIGAASDGATVTGTGGSANHWTGLTYKPAANYCNSPDSSASADPETFSYTVNGGDTATVSVTVVCVNDAPTVGTDSFTGVVGNTAFVVDDTTNHGGTADGPQSVTGPKKSVTGDILANDSDVETPNAITIVPGSFTSTDGGTVDIQADGDFTYVSDPPEAGTGCNDVSDSFSYTVSDNDPSGALTTQGTVNIILSGCVWYVSNSATGNEGTSTKPFDTLAQAQSSSGAGDSIFVFKGDGSSGGQAAGIDLQANQKLIGEAATLTVGSDTLQAGDATKRPLLADSGANVVSLDDANTVKGLQLDPAGAGSGIAGASGDTGGGTIDDVRIIDTSTAGTEPAFELDSTTGTFDVSNLTVDNSTATSPTASSEGVHLNNAGTVNFASAGTISVTTKGAKGLDVLGTNMGTGSVFDDITVTSSGSGGVSIGSAAQPVTGTTTLGDGVGTDLDLGTASSPTAAFALDTAGTVSVGSAGSDNIAAGGGPAVTVNSTPATMDFDGVSSTNSTTTGISLTSLGAGTFSAQSGTIGGNTGTAFNVNGGSGDISYPGDLINGAGQAVQVANRTNGAIMLGGNLSDTTDVGGGILISTNTGGSTTFTGTTTINTTTAGSPTQNNAVSMLASDGHTLTFSGGGLNIDTLTGKGIEADTSGTLAVTGTGNTIDTTTGRALNVTATDIGTGGVNFDSISSSGAANGILLNNTGTTAGLTVAGTGGSCTVATPTCTGGTIQGSTGAGIDITSAKSASLTRMRVMSGGDDGIRAATVSGGMTLGTSLVSGNGNAVFERGLDWTNVTGTTTIADSIVTGSAETNAWIENTTNGTTNNLGITGSTFSNNSTTLGANGITLSGDGTATVNATVGGSTPALGNTFTTNKQYGLQLATSGGTPTMNLTVDHNNMSGGNVANLPGAGILVVAPSGGAKTRTSVVNNTITGNVDGSVVIMNPLPSSTDSFDATVDNNTITPGASNGTAGIALWVQANGSGVRKFAIRNNAISQWHANALRMESGENGGGTVDYTVTGNTMSGGLTPRTDTITLKKGTGSAKPGEAVCANIGGAGVLANTFGGTAGAGFSDLKVDARFAGSMRFPDYVVATNDIQTYFRSRNIGLPTVDDVNGYAYTGGAPSTCALPAAP